MAKTKNLLRNKVNQAIIQPTHQSGRGAARLARLHGVQEVEGSNPFAPTEQRTAEKRFFVCRSFSHRGMIKSFRPD
jgi:hypothetical protein